MTLETIKDLSIIGAGIIGLVTLAVAARDYRLQGYTARASHFVQMRRRFLETEQFRHISELLARDDPSLTEIAIQDRRNYIGLLEEVALMTNSKLIRPEVAHYMFGYYVLLADRSRNFWDGLDRDSIYWSVFRSFARAMDRFEKSGTREIKELGV